MIGPAAYEMAERSPLDRSWPAEEALLRPASGLGVTDPAPHLHAEPLQRPLHIQRLEGKSHEDNGQAN